MENEIEKMENVPILTEVADEVSHEVSHEVPEPSEESLSDDTDTKIDADEKNDDSESHYEKPSNKGSNDKGSNDKESNDCPCLALIKSYGFYILLALLLLFFTFFGDISGTYILYLIILGITLLFSNRKIETASILLLSSIFLMRGLPALSLLTFLFIF